MILSNRGKPNSPIWIILDKPYENDSDKGYILSGSMGWIYDKMLSEAGLDFSNIYFTCFKPDLEHQDSYRNIIGELVQFMPSFIVPLGDCAKRLLPQCESRTKKEPQGTGKVSLEKWAGSILTSPLIQYPHYVIPNYDPEFICSNWAYRDIAINLDLGHVREEYEYWKTHKSLNPLPSRTLGYNLGANDVLSYLRECRSCRLVSVDIETIRPKKDSVLRGNPGYTYTFGIAKSPTDAISFNLWSYAELERLLIWLEIDYILKHIPQVGQNYFSFDSHLLEALGFGTCLWKCHDTMFRHHILWPELPHKLQFMTKQYTRENFYKDEGKNWSPRNMSQLYKYNCLDVCVTYEIYNEQEKEFKERSHLLK